MIVCESPTWRPGPKVSLMGRYAGKTIGRDKGIRSESLPLSVSISIASSESSITWPVATN